MRKHQPQFPKCWVSLLIVRSWKDYILKDNKGYVALCALQITRRILYIPGMYFMIFNLMFYTILSLDKIPYKIFYKVFHDMSYKIDFIILRRAREILFFAIDVLRIVIFSRSLLSHKNHSVMENFETEAITYHFPLGVVNPFLAMCNAYFQT